MIVRSLYRLSLLLCFLSIAFLVVSICYEVLSRSLFERPTGWVVELSSYVFLWFALFSIAIGLADDKHLRVEMLTERLRPRARAALEVATLAATMFIFLLITIYGALTFHEAWVNGWVHTWGRLFVPMVYTHAAAPLVGAISLVFLGQRMIVALRTLTGKNGEVA